MRTVILCIPPIVEDVNRARKKTERGQAETRIPERINIRQLPTEQQRCQDKEILDPLMRPDRRKQHTKNVATGYGRW